MNYHCDLYDAETHAPSRLSSGGLWGQLVGPSVDDQAEELKRDLELTGVDDLEFVPLVLVVGATGRTGRIIVRKLVLQGFRVVVLVRSLSTDTLNLLGSGGCP